LNNHRICNGKNFTELAKRDGVLAVRCSQNNGGQDKPPEKSAFVYSISIAIPKRPSGRGSTHRQDGITTLLELESGSGTDVTLSQTPTTNTVGIENINVIETIAIFN
jgi:hypothetical protein